MLHRISNLCDVNNVGIMAVVTIGGTMNGSWLGFAAIVVFALLLVFFFAAIAIAPTVATVAGPAAASQPIVLATVVGNAGTAAAASAPANQAAAQTGASQTSVVTHTIQTGEWLSSVARQYNTTVPAILAANPQITNSNVVRPGQTIRIPAP